MQKSEYLAWLDTNYGRSVLGSYFAALLDRCGPLDRWDRAQLKVMPDATKLPILLLKRNRNAPDTFIAVRSYDESFYVMQDRTTFAEGMAYHVFPVNGDELQRVVFSVISGFRMSNGKVLDHYARDLTWLLEALAIPEPGDIVERNFLPISNAIITYPSTNPEARSIRVHAVGFSDGFNELWIDIARNEVCGPEGYHRWLRDYVSVPAAMR